MVNAPEENQFRVLKSSGFILLSGGFLEKTVTCRLKNLCMRENNRSFPERFVRHAYFTENAWWNLREKSGHFRQDWVSRMEQRGVCQHGWRMNSGVVFTLHRSTHLMLPNGLSILCSALQMVSSQPLWFVSAYKEQRLFGRIRHNKNLGYEQIGAVYIMRFAFYDYCSERE